MIDHPETLEEDVWILRLYINGFTPSTVVMVERLREICTISLGKNFSLEVVDLALNPELGAVDRILALPTLVRKLPVPIRKIIGDFTNLERLRVALNLPAERMAA
jgi:circadian clock protein KaiB